MPISKEIKNVSGFDNVKDLAEAMPDNPDAVQSEGKSGFALPKKRVKKNGGVSFPPSRKSPSIPAPSPDPFANDPRYQQACARMAAFGGKGMIERGFDAGAKMLEDPTFKLNSNEQTTWDDFFYVLSKKPMFDVGRPIFLALFFVVTLLAQLGWRVVERSDSEFIQTLFKPKAEPEPETK